jgi:phage terminase large subunit GpA-like protein
MIYVFPRVEDAELFSKERLDPMFRDTPILQGLISDATRDKRNTMRRKSIPAGYIGLVGSNSPAALAARSSPVVRADEVNRMAESAGDEGDPLGIIFRRMARFEFSSFAAASSPTIEGACRITSEYATTDQREWWVPCPHCDVPQMLRFGGRDTEWGIKWVSGRPETAVYVCCHCSKSIAEHYKAEMNAGAEWVPQVPDMLDRGYWLNALVSPFAGARWPRLVAEFLEKKADPTKLQGFVNTVLCETWREDGVQASEEELLERLEAYDPSLSDEARPIPAGAAIITRSVDVQDDRLETAVWAFGADDESWLIDYDYIPGDPGTGTPWRELTDIRARTYRHASGHELKPFATFIDSGGHHTQMVYRYAKRYIRDNVWAIRGVEGEGAPILGKPSRNNSAKVTVYAVSSFSGKETFLKRLIKVTEPGPAFVHLPHWLEGEQLRQFGNEQLVPRFVNGRLKRVWVRKGPNEMIDLAVYALAALQLLGEKKLAELGAVAQWMMDNPPNPANGSTSEVVPNVPRRRVRSAGVQV